MIYYSLVKGKIQYFVLDLKTFKTRQLTETAEGVAEVNIDGIPVNVAEKEILDTKNREIIYQIDNRVFATQVDTAETREILCFPPDSDMQVNTLNADGTLLAGVFSENGEAEKIRGKYLKHKDSRLFAKEIYEAHLKHFIFVYNLKTGEIQIVHEEKAWLNHLQFSPSNPNLLLYCHEGPWHEVDRIWTINLKTKEITQIHKRTMPMEIAGHEFWSSDGNTIWFDLQQPRGEKFFLCGIDAATGEQIAKYELSRDEFSIHYNQSPDGTLFCGDGSEGRVSKGTDGKWIYLFRKTNKDFPSFENLESLKSERLVNLQRHDYRLEPNVHFSPDGKMVIFTSNMKGKTQIYGVEIEKSQKI